MMDTASPTVLRVLRAFGGCGLRRCGGGWKARCPAHDDQTPSVSITEMADGGAWVVCFAGCDKARVLQLVGLTVDDLKVPRNGFHPPTTNTVSWRSTSSQQRNNRGKLGVEVAHYDYTDEQGTVLLQVVRFAPKDFRQRRPDGQWGVKGVRLVLYRLPELLAGKADEPVFITEGEKDADALISKGLRATTNVGGAGAGKWRPEYNDPLRGQHVVVLPDNDDAGRDHAEQVAASVATVAASVKVLALPGLPAKGDVSDWIIAASGTKAALLDLVRKARPWRADGAGSGQVSAPAQDAPADDVPPPDDDPGDADIDQDRDLAGHAGDLPAMRQAGNLSAAVLQRAPLMVRTTGVEVTSSNSPAWPDPPGQDAYYGLAGHLVNAIDPHTESDRVAILVQMLAAFGNAIGRGPYFAVESSRHYPNLNVVLVGVTSKGRKGTSWDHVKRLMGEADPDWANGRIGKGLSTGEGLIWAVRDAIYKQDAIKKGGEITGYREALVDEGVSDKRLLAVETEFTKMLRLAQRNENTLSTTVREAWDSGHLRILNKNSPAVATGAHISIVGHATRDDLLRYLCETEMANGFANRFLWMCVRRSKMLPDGGGALEFAPYAQEVRTSLAFARRLGDTAVPRDAAAREIWHAVYEDLSTGRPGIAAAILGRAEAQVMRLALVYALLDQAAAIGAPHLRAALALWEYVEQSVRYVFGDATGDRVADDILHALRASADGLTRTELSGYLGHHVSSDRLGAALELLRQNGRAEVHSESTGGRPAQRWRCVRSEQSERTGSRGDLTSPTSLLSRLEVANGQVP